MAVINVLKIIFPFYHSVSDRELLHIKHLYRVRTIKEFRRDLDFFLRFYHPLDINQLIKSFDNDTLIDKRSFVLSFDDGLSQVYDIIVPILKGKGVNAIFFLNPSFIDNRDLFFRYKASVLAEKFIQSKNPALIKVIGAMTNKKYDSKKDIINYILSVNYDSKAILDELAIPLEIEFAKFLSDEKPYLSDAQIHSIIKDGFFIGSHSIDHPHYDRISFEEKLHQTIDSMNILQKQYSINYRLFSFPFSDFGVSKKFFDEIYRTNNRQLDLSFGISGIKKDIISRNIQRLPIENYSVPAAWSVFIQYIYWLLKIPFGKNTIQRF